jgi:hypothetical protein
LLPTRNVSHLAGCWRPTPEILATQEVEIRRIPFKASPGKYLEKSITKKGLVEWLKV